MSSLDDMVIQILRAGGSVEEAAKAVADQGLGEFYGKMLASSFAEKLAKDSNFSGYKDTRSAEDFPTYHEECPHCGYEHLGGAPMCPACDQYVG